MRTANHQAMLDFQYFSRMDREIYGTPEPEPPQLRERIVYGYADTKEVRLAVNALENKVNGLMKMSHTHSKKVSKYNTYEV